MKIYHLRNNLMICMNLGENLIVGGGGQVGDTVYQPRQTETHSQSIFGSTHSKHVHICEDLFEVVFLNCETYYLQV